MRVLLTRLSSFGDIVHTWPLAKALRGAGHSVGWVVERPYAPLVAANPAVERVVVVATRTWRRAPWSATTRDELDAARADLQDFDADVALDPQGLVKSAVWARIAGCRRRIGHALGWRREALAGLFYSETVRPPRHVRHVVDLNLSLARALGVDPPWGDRPDGRFLVAGTASSAGPDGLAPVALIPATGGSGKAWPVERFAALARRLAAERYPSLILWGPDEQRLAHRLARDAGPASTVAPPTTLPELAALLATCEAAVGGDTGPLHLAAALGVPTVGIFRRTDAARNGPLGELVRVVSNGADADGPTVEEVLACSREVLRGVPR